MQARTEVHPVPNNNGTVATPSANTLNSLRDSLDLLRDAPFVATMDTQPRGVPRAGVRKASGSVGAGPQPSNNHWTPKSVKDAKKAAMVHTPPPRYQQPRQQKKPREQQPHQQQSREQPHQQQPRQQQPRQQEPRQQSTTAPPKRKKVAFKAQAITLADLDSDLEWSDDDSARSYGSARSYRSFDLIGEEDCRVVSDATPLANPRENKRRIPVKERLEQPNTYASKLKGPAPGPSAKLPEQPLKFVKRNSNKVKR